MPSANKPEEYNHVMPYIIVKDAAGLMQFMQNVLGADEKMKHLSEDGMTVMHGEVTIGDSVVMVAEAKGPYGPDTAAMFVYVQDADDTYKQALAAGATSIMAVADHPYGRSGGIKDPYGNTWWVTSVATKSEA